MIRPLPNFRTLIRPPDPNVLTGFAHFIVLLAFVITASPLVLKLDEANCDNYNWFTSAISLKSLKSDLRRAPRGVMLP